MAKETVSISQWGLGGLGLLVGSVGILVMSARGRRLLHSVSHKLENAPSHLEQWNDAAERELARLQRMLDELASSMQLAR
jgi:hypothetical protein